jgi:hypothetical protein
MPNNSLRRKVDVLMYSECEYAYHTARGILLSTYDDLAHTDAAFTSDEVNHEYVNIAVRELRKCERLDADTIEEVASFLYSVWVWNSEKVAHDDVKQCMRLIAIIAKHYVRKYAN